MAVVAQYETEAASAAAFDEAVESVGLFNVYKEVPGTLIQPRPGQTDKGMRIDRILIPNQHLLSLGWQHGIVGIEIKSGNEPMGPAIAQAMDYSRSAFTLPSYYFRVMPSWVFIWPMPKDAHGPLESILAQNRIGSATSTYWTKLQFKSSNNLLHVSYDGSIRIGAGRQGMKAGSR